MKHLFYFALICLFVACKSNSADQDPVYQKMLTDFETSKAALSNEINQSFVDESQLIPNLKQAFKGKDIDPVTEATINKMYETITANSNLQYELTMFNSQADSLLASHKNGNKTLEQMQEDFSTLSKVQQTLQSKLPSIVEGKKWCEEQVKLITDPNYVPKPEKMDSELPSDEERTKK